MSTSPVVPNAPSSGTSNTTSNGLPSSQSLNNMFLQLLVAQLQNQDPTNPVDPSQFVGQLAQFSELSEVTSINNLLQQLVPTTSGSTGSGNTGTGTSGTGSNGSGTNTPGTTSPSGNAAAPAGVPLPSALPGFGNLPFVTPALPATFPNFSIPAATIQSKILGGF